MTYKKAMENGSRKEVIAPAAAATTAASPSYRDIFPIRLDFLFKAFQPLARLLAKFLILTQVAHIGCDTKLHSSNRTFSFERRMTFLCKICQQEECVDPVAF